QRSEPDDHDRPEQLPHGLRSARLNKEQAEEDRHGNRQDVGFEHVRADAQALDRAQYRNRGRHDSIAVKQRRAEKAEADHHRPRPESRLRPVWNQRHQRQDAALALVIRAQDEDQVFDRDDEHQGPEDQGQDADDVLSSGGDAVGGIEALAKRVERARADVAVNNAEGAERQEREPAPLWAGRWRTHTLTIVYQLGERRERREGLKTKSPVHPRTTTFAETPALEDVGGETYSIRVRDWSRTS